jgi:hypothetical protein
MLPNDKAFQPPNLPAGFPLAGVPGANQGIDPAVMNQVRTIAHTALDVVLQWAFANVVPLLLQALKQGPQAVNAATSEIGSLAVNQGPAPDDLMAKGAGNARQAANRIGPFPHGDVDLRFMGPNIAPNVRPARGGRKFYFLDDTSTPAQVPQKAADGTEQRNRGTQAAGVEIIGFKPG